MHCFPNQKVMGSIDTPTIKTLYVPEICLLKCHGTWIIPVLLPLNQDTRRQAPTSPVTAFISALTFHRSPLLHCKQPHLPSNLIPKYEQVITHSYNSEVPTGFPHCIVHMIKVLGLVFFTTWWYFLFIILF